MAITITIEDGSIIDNSNSFVDDTFLSDFIVNRGAVAPDSEKLKMMLVSSYEFMTTLPWCTSHDEAFEVTNSMISAQCHIAMFLENNSSLFNDNSSQSEIKSVRKKTDVLDDKVEFFENGKSIESSFNALALKVPLANNLLKDLLCDYSEGEIGIYVV